MNQFVANGPNGGLRSIASVEFSQNVLNVFFNGVEAQLQRRGDFFVAQAERYMPQHLRFARRQRIQRVDGTPP
jgi:hypothetical protein